MKFLANILIISWKFFKPFTVKEGTIWVFHVRPICQIIWQILSYTAQNKFHQKYHESHALLTELVGNLLEKSEGSFLLFHVPLHMLDFVYF